VIDEYTIHQNQSIWHFSRDLKTLTVTRDHAAIRWGKRKEIAPSATALRRSGATTSPTAYIPLSAV